MKKSQCGRFDDSDPNRISPGIRCCSGYSLRHKPGGEKIYFQPEAALEYSQVTANDTVITVTDSPAYYRLIAENGNFHPVIHHSGFDDRNHSRQ